MKKLISALLVLTMLCTLIPAACAEKSSSFKYKSVLGDLEGYAYNEKDKYWSYTCTCQFGKFSTTLYAKGVEGKSRLDYVMLKIKLDSEDEGIELNGVGFIIDGMRYSYKTMKPGDGESYVYLGKAGQKLLTALAGCDTSEIKCVYYSTMNGISVSIEYQPMEFSEKEIQNLKEFSKVFVENDIWSTCKDKTRAKESEAKYPLLIEEVPEE